MRVILMAGVVTVGGRYEIDPDSYGIVVWSSVVPGAGDSRSGLVKGPVRPVERPVRPTKPSQGPVLWIAPSQQLFAPGATQTAHTALQTASGGGVVAWVTDGQGQTIAHSEPSQDPRARQDPRRECSVCRGYHVPDDRHPCE